MISWTAFSFPAVGNSSARRFRPPVVSGGNRRPTAFDIAHRNSFISLPPAGSPRSRPQPTTTSAHEPTSPPPAVGAPQSSPPVHPPHQTGLEAQTSPTPAPATAAPAPTPPPPPPTRGAGPPPPPPPRPRHPGPRPPPPRLPPAPPPPPAPPGEAGGVGA